MGGVDARVRLSSEDAARWKRVTAFSSYPERVYEKIFFTRSVLEKPCHPELVEGPHSSAGSGGAESIVVVRSAPPLPTKIRGPSTS
jgi:hypothetical protein